MAGQLLTAGLAFLFARPIVRAIGSLTAAAGGLARGELDQQVQVYSQDELGQMAHAFRSMVAYLTANPAHVRVIQAARAATGSSSA